MATPDTAVPRDTNVPRDTDVPRDTAVPRVVLLDETGQPIGSMPKSAVHTSETPLHLAFSCYLLDSADRVLLTRRALTKTAWPGVWTNSFCGHPEPGEDIAEAVVRRARQELGTAIDSLRVVDPEFRYRAVDASGIVENEVCPVYVGRVAATLDPSPAEVAEWQWVPIAEVVAAVRAAPFAFSPWMVDQIASGVIESLRS